MRTGSEGRPHQPLGPNLFVHLWIKPGQRERRMSVPTRTHSLGQDLPRTLTLLFRDRSLGGSQRSTIRLR